ncbi:MULTISPECIES: hypothetical protein [Haloarcula]|uniref:Uncharacterized protein n=1 Tax=Haloarcula pellucida TaxID=1427151 RepID=A0A830GL05_9EURY|nr:MULTISPECIES: hypothetical protein [Halomicroarcula]MBX0349834.1 hypothetical protein [Halomicroarcula pellucida]MDS0279577.1 hypothetical protein [Halomicroarcula sp. S1AR25-4]GGN94587.1 hypothetical protein GCM10009030_21050 [Halomicroarcula pellucida]
MEPLQLPFDSGFVEIAAQLVGAVGALVLLLLLVAFGGFAYKSLAGDGIRWPDETEEAEEEDGVTRGSDEDDWKFY